MLPMMSGPEQVLNSGESYGCMIIINEGFWSPKQRTLNLIDLILTAGTLSVLTNWKCTDFSCQLWLVVEVY